MSKESGHKLTLSDIDEVATKITGMYTKYNQQRATALLLGQEVRNFIFATDIDSTTSGNLDTSNRTHIPKLTELSDTLQSNYWETIFGDENFFIFTGETSEDRARAKKIEAWIRTKLASKKFRETEGRKLVADFVIYGNCFINVDFIVERDDTNDIVFKGCTLKRVSPLSIVFDAEAETFDKSPKIRKSTIHIADLAELAHKYPNANYKAGLIKKILKTREASNRSDWVEMLHKENFEMDGFGSYEAYLQQDYVEVLTYRGDVYDSKTGKIQKHRIIEVVDGLHVIRNEANPSPVGMSGIHHIACRTRPDNLWGMGLLDGLAGMQYRVNKVENLKADVMDAIAHPIVIHRGGNALNKISDIYRPGEFIDLDEDETLEFERPDANILRYADSHMDAYFTLMENFAGATPQERGIRTPGEKTAAEVRSLDSKGSKLFKDKAKIFEAGLESALKEAFELTLKQFDGVDYMEIFDDEEGLTMLQELSKEDINARGSFTAVGSKHWDVKNKRKTELSQILAQVLAEPGLKAHSNGWQICKAIEEIYQIDDMGIFERYRGVKDDVQLQAIAQAEGEQLNQQLEQSAQVQQQQGGGFPQPQ